MIDNININREEVLRYMGYKGQLVDDAFNTQLTECIAEMKNLIKPRYIYRYFDIDAYDDRVTLKSSDVNFRGKDILNHLKNCDQIALMAVTLGIDVERKIRSYEINNITKSIIMDACATTAVEEVCDIVQKNIEDEVALKGLYITNRYSPGYGDLPISSQYDFIRILDTTRTIGLSVTDSNLLIPRKSVTAIIGISKYKRNTAKSCDNCSNREGCEFRKNDMRCS